MLQINKSIFNNYLKSLNLATLGPIGTSSEYVTNRLLEKSNLIRYKLNLFETYEEAFHSVKYGFSDILIVANAYKNINKFYMDNKINLLATFIHNTPKYGIATRKDFIFNKFSNVIIKIASHHAPIKKLDYLSNGVFENVKFHIKYFNSTSEAAIKVKNNEIDFCLTNEEAIKKYDLKLVSELTDISMCWSIFGKTETIKTIIILNEMIKGNANEMCNFN